MSMEQSPDDVHRSTIVSRSPGLAYERMREVRRTHFAQPLAKKLSVEGALLVALAAALSLALGVGGATGGGGAAVELVTLAAGAGALVAAGATGHAVVGAYRLHVEPLTEREALACVTVEDAASYLGIATGGLLVAAAVLAALVGLVTGWGPAAGPVTVTIAVMAGTVVAGGLSLGAGRYLDGRLPRES